MNSMLMALAIALGGVAVGWLVQRLLNRRARQGVSVAFVSAQWIEALGRAVFWLSLVASLVLAALVLGAPTLEELYGQVSAWLPRIAVAFSLVLVAHLSGQFFAEMLMRGASPNTLRATRLLARSVRIGLVALGIVLALGTLGLEVTWLLVSLALLGSVLVAALALALSLGSVELVRDLVSMQQVRSDVTLGRNIRVGDVEGRVVSLQDTTVTLETTRGFVRIPGSLLQREVVHFIGEREHD